MLANEENFHSQRNLVGLSNNPITEGSVGKMLQEFIVSSSGRLSKNVEYYMIKEIVELGDTTNIVENKFTLITKLA